MTETIPGYVVGTWDLDPVHSHVGFVARHLMVSKVRGHFPKFEATIVTAEDPLQSTVEATIDTTSVTTDNDTRDEDLRSERFFDVEHFPQMTFRSADIRRHGDDYIMEGSLTARGETRPVSLTVELNGFGPDPYGGTRAGFSARGELNRLDFGVSFNAPIPGGVMISEKIQVEIEAEAVLRKPQE
jgi:polyisoprenoid-binding protein YceI